MNVLETLHQGIIDDEPISEIIDNLKLVEGGPAFIAVATREPFDYHALMDLFPEQASEVLALLEMFL